MLGDSMDSPSKFFGFVGSWWCKMTSYVLKHNANLSSIIWNVQKEINICIFGATLLTYLGSVYMSHIFSSALEKIFMK
jgi:hypothetical protein